MAKLKITTHYEVVCVRMYEEETKIGGEEEEEKKEMYINVRTRDHMISFVSSREKKAREKSGDGYSEAIFTATTDGAPAIAVQAWMVLSDFPWSSICSREAEPTTHPSFGDGLFFSSSYSGFCCLHMRTTCMYRSFSCNPHV
ncbi:unnamed protein product, partial [Brassica napus]